jgi:hypothetical protein
MPRIPRSLLAFLLGLTAIRLALAAALPVGDDEAYYWEWSRHLAAGYVDHPPAVAYLVWAAVGILGRTPFALHVVAVVLSLATALALWTLTREVLGRDDAALWVVMLFSIIPVFAAGSILTAPDGPLFLCWVMTLLWTWRAANGTGRGAWLAAGAWLGLGLQSKYAAVVLPVSVGLWLLLSPTQRRWLARPEPYAGCALALAIFAPVVWWNAGHHWVSFALTALGTSRWTDRGNFPFFVASQFVYLGPLMFPALVWGLVVAARRWIAERDARWGFLAAAGWPVVLGACAGSLVVWAKPHWSAPGFLTAIIAAAGLATEHPRRVGAPPRWLSAGVLLWMAAGRSGDRRRGPAGRPWAILRHERLVPGDGSVRLQHGGSGPGHDDHRGRSVQVLDPAGRPAGMGWAVHPRQPSDLRRRPESGLLVDRSRAEHPPGSWTHGDPSRGPHVVPPLLGKAGSSPGIVPLAPRGRRTGAATYPGLLD